MFGIQKKFGACMIFVCKLQFIKFVLFHITRYLRLSKVHIIFSRLLKKVFLFPIVRSLCPYAQLQAPPLADMNLFQENHEVEFTVKSK